MERRALLFTLIAALLGSLVLSACAAPTGSEAEGNNAPANDPLLILDWSGYEATAYPQFYGPFIEKYGEDLDNYLEYTFFADDAEAFAKQQSGLQADIIHPCSGWFDLWVENDLIQPIDTSRLSNWDGIHPAFKEMVTIDGEVYFIPWEWGYDSILVRSDLAPEMPTSWNDLWDEQYAGHIAIWDVGETNYIVAALALGLDPYDTTPEEDAMIREKLVELKNNVQTYWTDYTETYELPTTGDIWLMANVWQDAYASLVGDYDVAYIQPEEGRLGWLCAFAIGSHVSGEQLDLAYEYLDAALAPESMAALGNEFWYGFSNMDALPMVDEFVVDFMDLDQVDTLTERTVFYEPISEERRQLMIAMWSEVKAAP